MQKKEANFSPVRPFKSVALDELPDLEFASWKLNHPGPFALEIGAGVGWHSITWAQRNPNKSLISLERTKTKFEKFQSRLDCNTVPNVFAKNDDALYWVPINLQGESLHSLYLLYPNPYPKEKQANKRWHRSSLLHLLIEKLTHDGKVYLATNEEFYAKEARLYMTEFWDLRVVTENNLNSKNFKTPRTHFEKKYLERGETIYDFVFSKKT